MVKEIDKKIILICLISLLVIFMALFIRGFIASLPDGLRPCHLPQGQPVYRVVRVRDTEDRRGRDGILTCCKEEDGYQMGLQTEGAGYIPVSAGEGDNGLCIA